MKPQPILLTPLLAVLPLHHAQASTGLALTADVKVDTRTSLPVTIPDPALLAALRTALAKPTGPITEADLLTLTTLRINGLGIADLSGLEKATNLRILDVRRNAFADPAALWVVLDQITPMYCLYVDVRRPGNDPAGLLTQTLTDTSGNTFFILLDTPNLPTLDFNSLNISTTDSANLQVLQVISNAGVQVDTPHYRCDFVLGGEVTSISPGGCRRSRDGENRRPACHAWRPAACRSLGLAGIIGDGWANGRPRVWLEAWWRRLRHRVGHPAGQAGRLFSPFCN